jgi:hypothetical protein
MRAEYYLDSALRSLGPGRYRLLLSVGLNVPGITEALAEVSDSRVTSLETGGRRMILLLAAASRWGHDSPLSYHHSHHRM